MDLYNVKGPTTIFSEAEEKMALWLSKMAQRGLRLRMFEFLDFVEDIVKREKRNMSFKMGVQGRSGITPLCKDQESIQSSTTPDPGYQWISDKFTMRLHKKKPSPFQVGDHKA